MNDKGQIGGVARNFKEGRRRTPLWRSSHLGGEMHDLDVLVVELDRSLRPISAELGLNFVVGILASRPVGAVMGAERVREVLWKAERPR